VTDDNPGERKYKGALTGGLGRRAVALLIRPESARESITRLDVMWRSGGVWRRSGTAPTMTPTYIAPSIPDC